MQQVHSFEGLNILFVSLGSDWVNPEDPNVIAENELLGAAAAIEAAARKLAELKPRERPRVSYECLLGILSKREWRELDNKLVFSSLREITNCLQTSTLFLVKVVFVKVFAKRKLSFRYLNELLK